MMKLKPLEQYICDTCNGIIEKPEDGWFEWLTEKDPERGVFINKSFRICHHQTKCMLLANHRNVSDNHLQYFIKENAAIHLLAFLDKGTFIEKGNYMGPYIADHQEYVELSRRLLIPHYEEARLYFEEAASNGFDLSINEIRLYTQETLLYLIETYGDGE